jgi:hypothetical protein
MRDNNRIPFTTSHEIARTIQRGQVVMVVKPGSPMVTETNVDEYAKDWCEWGLVDGFGSDWVEIRMVNPAVKPPKLTDEVRRVGYDDIAAIMPK